MMITMEKLDAAKTSIDKLIAQGQTLFADIAETAQDRARLLQEAEQTERDLAASHERIRQLQSRVDELETMLDSVRATVDLVKPNGAVNPEPAHRSNEAAGKAGLAALHRLAEPANGRAEP